MSDSSNDRGWAPVLNGRKWHYFVAGRSLCGKYMFFGPGSNLIDSNHYSKDNCAACRRKFEKASSTLINP